MTPTLGVAFPQWATLSSANTEDSAQFLMRLERAGFAAVWVQEQLLGQDPSYEPLSSLAFAAGATRHLRLASATIVGPLRNPIQLAKAAATVDRLSGGRLDLGLSLGGDLTFIFDAVGIDLSERVSRLEECVEIMRRLWTEEIVDHRGKHWSFEGVSMEPKPRQRPLPLSFGGGAPAALRRAVELGDGWIGAGGASLDAFAAQAATVRRLVEEAGRDLSQFTISKKLYLAVEDNPAIARERFARWVALHWSTVEDPVAFADRIGIVGDHTALLDAVERAHQAGADHVILNPVYDEERHLDVFIDLFGKEAT